MENSMQEIYITILTPLMNLLPGVETPAQASIAAVQFYSAYKPVVMIGSAMLAYSTVTTLFGFLRNRAAR